MGNWSLLSTGFAPFRPLGATGRDAIPDCLRIGDAEEDGVDAIGPVTRKRKKGRWETLTR